MMGRFLGVMRWFGSQLKANTTTDNLGMAGLMQKRIVDIENRY